MHTISSARVANIWLNERLTGEFGLNAALCGHYGAPVILISGDLAACQEAEKWAPGVEQVVVKQATSRHSAHCLSMVRAQKIIEESAERAVRRLYEDGAPLPLPVAAPVKVMLEFIQPAMADTAQNIPSSVRLDGRKLEMQSLDRPSAYLTLRAATNLGSE